MQHFFWPQRCSDIYYCFYRKKSVQLAKDDGRCHRWRLGQSEQLGTRFRILIRLATVEVVRPSKAAFSCAAKAKTRAIILWIKIRIMLSASRRWPRKMTILASISSGSCNTFGKTSLLTKLIIGPTALVMLVSCADKTAQRVSTMILPRLCSWTYNFGGRKRDLYILDEMWCVGLTKTLSMAAFNLPETSPIRLTVKEESWLTEPWTSRKRSPSVSSRGLSRGMTLSRTPLILPTASERAFITPLKRSSAAAVDWRASTRSVASEVRPSSKIVTWFISERAREHWFPTELTVSIQPRYAALTCWCCLNKCQSLRFQLMRRWRNGWMLLKQHRQRWRLEPWGIVERRNYDLRMS